MLNKLLIYTIRLLSRLASFKVRRQLVKSFGEPELAQMHVLNQLQKKLKNTPRVKTFSWHSEATYPEFSDEIPLVDYEDLDPFIREQMKTGRLVLSPEPPSFYERTSGGSGAAKFIPYTRNYLNILHRLFILWAGDLLQSNLHFRSLKTFLCVSPTLHENLDPNVGSNTDVDYVAPWLGSIIERFLAVPLSLHKVRDPLVYRDLLSLYLIAADDLEIISIWSPSLWFAIQDHFIENRSRLSKNLADGFYQAPANRWTFKAVSKDRLALLKEDRPQWSKIWPRLTIISCWNEGHAEAAAHQLANTFPNVLLQGKGLLATEAPVSLPWLAARGALPFLNEVFIEGEDQEDGKIYPLWKWQKNRLYSVIVSLPNGILRYRLRDIVTVSGFYKKTPILNFVGREGRIVDMVGEKLQEDFAFDALRRVVPNLGLDRQCGFFPVQIADQSFYILILDSDTSMPEKFPERLDGELQKAHHYRLARNLGQLKAIQVAYSPRWPQLYLELAALRNQQLGNIKIPRLHKIISSEDDILFLRGIK